MVGGYELIINLITINETTFQVQRKIILVIDYYLLLPTERKRKKVFISVRREIYDNKIEEEYKCEKETSESTNRKV